MPLISLARAELTLGHVPLLAATDFQIDHGERVALIGRNGSGKSSLLKVIAGQRALDDGVVQRDAGVVTAYVPQEPELDERDTVFDAVAAGLSTESERLLEYERLAARLADTPEDPQLYARLHELQSALEAGGGWRLKSRVDRVISELGLEAGATVATLSGGNRKRVALAHALACEPDLLLLDEPTNHLDVDSIRWLEGLLATRQGALIVVTHDRRFLDRVATRIVELDRGVLRSYPGSFSAYQARKVDELAAEAAAQQRFDRLLAQEEVWIRKGIEARRTRNEGRVRRLESLRRERAARRDTAGMVNLAVAAGERSGKIVAELESVTKRFDGRPVVREFSATILRGDKVGLIGPNGAGKTTLLGLITGTLAPDAGRVRLGTKLATAYFDQMRAQLDEDATLVDTISPGSEWIDQGGTRKHTMSYLADFLFPSERARSPVRTLSGGERNRLLLARLFARPANLLVLDEPTNDLDIETLELLEELLVDYNGTVLLVSHDRAFLDNVVTQTIAAEGDGRWREYAGGYADYEAARERSAPVPAPAAARPESQRRREPRARAKLTYNEERELAALPDRITALETEQRTIEAQLGDAALYRDDPARVKQLNERFAAIDAELATSFARWEALEAKNVS